MAEGIVIEGKSLEELEREITCGICQEHYTEPKILPCLHYYCKQCVLRLALRTGVAKPFSCPECRGEATLPEEGVDKLKTAFFINRLKTTVSTMEQAHGKVEVKCESCSDSEDKAEAFCRQCAMFICMNCVNLHKKMKILLTHEVASLEDLKQGRAKAVAVKQPPTKLCSDHEEPLIIYCFDCETLICRDCTVKDHRDHNFEFCKKIAPKISQDLLEKLGPLKDQEILLSQAIEKVQTVKQQLKSDSHTMSSNIKTSFKKLRDILDQREQELLEEAAGQVEEKMEKLAAQEKKLSAASAEVQSVVDYTEQCVRHCTDNEVMSMHTEIRKQIEQKIEHSKSGRSLEPEEEADIGVEVRCGEALQQLIQTQANIIQLSVDPAKCTVTMEDVKHEVNKTCKATLVTRFYNNTISRRHHEVSCSLRSLYSNVRTQCKVEVTGSGQYSIQYTPTVRGRHELTILVDTQHVAGSPFPVFISIHPTELGKPVKVWKNITKPTGIAVSSTGDIIVAEECGIIVKFNKEGIRTVIVKVDKLQIHKLEVTEDYVYFNNKYSNKILRYNITGCKWTIHKLDHIINGKQGIAIVGDEVIVCSKDTSGTIMIYDKELKYVRCIKHEDKGYLYAISSDSHDNLYCADYYNDCVLVFSTDGVFLRSFICDEKGEKKVEWPWGLCVSGHYVYVCNNGSHNISVFTTDGLYVTSFGQHGSNEGDFISPHSVCVDKDGFVYVTDYLNNTVQCF